MSRALDSLDPRFRPLAIELLARIVEANIPILIVETLRTEADQLLAIKTGHSWVKRSKHQDGLAIDLVPYGQYNLYGPDKLEWDSKAKVWQLIGKIGKGLGLRWGGDWAQKDMGHFEYVEPKGKS